MNHNTRIILGWKNSNSSTHYRGQDSQIAPVIRHSTLKPNCIFLWNMSQGEVWKPSIVGMSSSELTLTHREAKNCSV